MYIQEDSISKPCYGQEATLINKDDIIEVPTSKILMVNIKEQQFKLLKLNETQLAEIKNNIG